jgi:hypothetical protein
MGTIALVREQLVYAVPEGTIGTLVQPTKALPAIGTATLSGIPTADQNIKIGDETWVFKASRSTAYQITIGGDADGTITNMVTAINLDSSVVEAADGALSTLVITCIDPGYRGNLLAFTKTAANMTIDGSGFLGATQAGTDGYLIVAAGPCTINQNPAFTDSPEIVDSRDVLERFSDMAPPGDFALSILARPYGIAGKAPMGDVLYESLMCKKTTNTSVSVVHSQDLSKPSFSLWVKKSHSMLFASGCAVTSGKVSLSNKGAVKWDMSGKFFQMGWVGTDSLSGTEAAAQTELSVHNAKKFCIGGLFQNSTTANDGTNGGAGFIITDVNYTGNTITIAAPGVPSGGWSENDVIEPFLPVGVIIGSPIESKNTALTVDQAPSTIKSMDLTIDDAATFFDDEITTSGYPESYVEDVRSITGTLGLRFRKDELAKLYECYAGLDVAWELIFGTVAGSKMKINLPKVNMEVPKMNDNAPVVDLEIPIKALGTEGEDSMTITWY